MRGWILAAVAWVLLGVLAACTSGSGGPSPAPSTVVRTQVVTESPSASRPPVVPPISTGPTSSATASSCPLLDEQRLAKMVGMRLDRVAVLKSGGKLVGCRFFALQHPTSQCPASCLANEKLPGPHQPAVEIQTYRYPSADAAYNAYVRLATKEGHHLQQDRIVGSTPGLCYELTFWPKDNGHDWACAFSTGSTMAVVRTVVVKAAFSVVKVAKVLAGEL